MTLNYEYDAIDPRSVSKVDFSRYHPNNPEQFVKTLESTARVISGTLTAATPEDVVRIIESKGLVPVRVALITGDKEGLLRLERMKEVRNTLLGVDKVKLSTPSRPRKKMSPQVLPYIIGTIIAIVGLISWIIQ